MSVREMAHDVIDRLSDKQISEIAKIIIEEYSRMVQNEGKTEAQRAYEKVKSMLKPAPDDFDPEKELDEYFEEKYGL